MIHDNGLYVNMDFPSRTKINFPKAGKTGYNESMREERGLKITECFAGVELAKECSPYFCGAKGCNRYRNRRDVSPIPQLAINIRMGKPQKNVRMAAP
ncbi:MAG: hypothetical protein LBO03_07485 [Acidaminococcales bacterium]|jgi:hypothetical protein|nr:hypothetical protein [Acidaminococcales bacterium]